MDTALWSLYPTCGIACRRRASYFWLVTVDGIKRALGCTYRDVLGHHTFQVAAALGYYVVLSVFPGLIFLSAVLGLIPLPDLFGRVLALISHLLPADAMRVVYSVLNDVLKAHRGTWLSLGMLGLIWTASSAFDAMIEALDVAYDVPDTRPFWKTRLLAIGLAGIIGGLLLSTLAVMVLGPRFGIWLAGHLGVSAMFLIIWPVLHWVIAIGFSILAVEILYYLAPNVKQRFLATLPGAALSVLAWDGLTYLLGIYIRHANFNLTYGALSGVIAFMTWLYWTSFVLLLGAELNAELAKESEKGCVPLKDAVPKDPQIAPRPSDVNRAA